MDWQLYLVYLIVLIAIVYLFVRFFKFKGPVHDCPDCDLPIKSKSKMLKNKS